ncbi:MAG TPA: MlaD family protein [Verrucomicrobiae bacterium]|nr:MlaD family protein [Verrucomicrobiae bacterium]
MDSKRLEIKVGLFVLIGLILLGALIIAFAKGASFFRGTYEVRMHSTTVSGLKPRAAVTLSGVQVGSVSDIQLAPDGKSVTIVLQIYKGTPIYSDARFAIQQSGFLGDQFVAILPQENELPVLTNGTDVDCDPPLDLQEMARSATGFVHRLDETAKKLDAAVTDLRTQVLNEQTLTNFAVAIENVRTVTVEARETVGDINQLISTNGRQISLAASNLVAFSQSLSHMADSADALLATNGDATIAVKNIETATESLKQLMADIQSGKGLAGTLLQNPEVATNVQNIAYNLSITTSNLNRLGLWKMLWHKELPKTNAPPK